MKSLKQKLKANEVTVGSWISIANVSIAEIMAKAGFDWLAIDMEHSAISIADLLLLIQTISLCNVPPLVRVSENDPNLIKRVMDIGAHGVIVPMVNSAKEAYQAVQSVKYPPLGKRGVGLFRAQGYGDRFEDYKKWLDQESIVIVQIEHINAVNALDDIFAVEGIDGFIVGPYDLSGSLGKPGEFDSPAMKNALNKIIQTAKRKKIPAGFHVVPPKPVLVQQKIKEGYRFVAYSADFILLQDKCKEGLSLIKEKLKHEPDAQRRRNSFTSKLKYIP